MRRRRMLKVRGHRRRVGLLVPFLLVPLLLVVALLAVWWTPSAHLRAAPAVVGLWSPWSLVQSPNPGAPTGGNSLSSVAAVSPANVWAVGTYSVPTSTSSTLTEQWNGTTWTVIPSPNGGSADNNALASVAAVSASDVWAVGNYGQPNSSNVYTLTEQWNGTHWSIVPSPNATIEPNVLAGVAAVSASDVWAVGNYVDPHQSFNYLTLIEQWNGTTWSIIPSPNGATAGNMLNAVAAVSANDVWAVGQCSPTATGYPQTLIEHWNGSQWSVVPSPNPGGTASPNYLYGVAAVSANDVWAVGEYADTATDKNYTLIEQWNGTRWSVVPSPNPDGAKLWQVSLNAVTAVSAIDVWAVGSSKVSTAGVPPATLIEQWNGARWSIVNSPNPSNVNPYDLLYLSGVAADSAHDVWAVGSYFGNGNPTQDQQTLTEVYSLAKGYVRPG